MASSRANRRTFPAGSTFGQYTVVKLLGQGGYGDVYEVKKTGFEESYAMKIESAAAEKKGLAIELDFMRKLQDSSYFPHLCDSGVTVTHKYAVIELLGPSVSNTRRKMPGHKISCGTAMRLSIFMLKCIRSFHRHGFVHQDIKPGNFLLRKGGKSPVVLIDFGLSRKFIDSDTGLPFPQRNSGSWHGTAKYSSLSAQRYYDQCPRDDLISWCYSVVELVEGKLPWGGDDDNAAMIAKRNIGKRMLFKSLPDQFLQIWDYINNLEYDSKVDYDRIMGLVMAGLEDIGEDVSAPFEWEASVSAASHAKLMTISAIEEFPEAAEYVSFYPKESTCIESIEDPDQATDCKCSVA